MKAIGIVYTDTALSPCKLCACEPWMMCLTQSPAVVVLCARGCRNSGVTEPTILAAIQAWNALLPPDPLAMLPAIQTSAIKALKPRRKKAKPEPLPIAVPLAEAIKII